MPVKGEPGRFETFLQDQARKELADLAAGNEQMADGIAGFVKLLGGEDFSQSRHRKFIVPIKATTAGSGKWRK